MDRTVWGLKRADGRGRVVHTAATSQSRYQGWESRAATTLCGQSGFWVQADDMDGPSCAACARAPFPAESATRCTSDGTDLGRRTCDCPEHAATKGEEDGR